MTGVPAMMATVCRRLGRNLTEEEWRQYVGAEPYAETCKLRAGSGLPH